MCDYEYSGFEDLLNSLSTTLALRILGLYNSTENGYTLTETARSLDESVSTIQEYLKRFQKTKITFRKDKTYFLSNLGCYVFAQLQKFIKINKLRNILGKIPAGMIPPKFLDILLSDLSNFEFNISSVHFMSYMNELVERLKFEIKNDDMSTFEVLGWWNLEMDLAFFRTFFKDFEINIPTFKKMFKSFSVRLITDNRIFREMEQNKEINLISEHFNFKEFMRFNGKLTNCNFTLMRYEDIIIFFLIKDDDFDFKNMILVRNNQNAVKFFTILFEYYWEESKEHT